MENNKSRVYHSLKNARVSLFFSCIAIFIGFFSRKIFLDRLGVEFVGLSGTLHSLLGFLNIAELGIGTAISYALYKPLADGDREKLNDIISVMGFLYSRVGLFILTAGVVLSFFLPLIFKNTAMPLLLIYCGFYTYLISSLFSYFLNYRMTLLSADQRNYVVTKNLQMSSITQLLVQMLAAKYCGNLYLFFAISLIFSGIYCIILNKKINAYYPWLKSSIKNGKKKIKDFPEIKQKIKQVFIHKIGGVSQSQITNILVYAFVSLKDVALLGNYTTVVSKASILSECLMGGTWASVGNVVASGDENKVYEVYEELVAVRCLIALSAVFVLYHTLESFISLWLGAEFILAQNILIFLLVESYLLLTRGVNDQFINAYGLFFDTWLPWFELGMIIVSGCLCGFYYGMSGIVFSSAISKVFTIIYWKPFLLFKHGFRLPIKHYCYLLLRLFIVISIVFILGNYVISLLGDWEIDDWMSWVAYCIIATLVGCSINIIFVFLILPGGNILRKRLLNHILIRKINV